MGHNSNNSLISLLSLVKHQSSAISARRFTNAVQQETPHLNTKGGN